MPRTITQITTDLKASFVTNTELANTYGLDQSKTFDEQFSKTAIEGLIIYVVAIAIWTLEKIIDAFSTEVDQRIETAYITSLRWYHATALAFQQGHELSFNTSTYKVEYVDTTSDEAIAARIVKYAAVKEYIPASDAERSKLIVKVSKAAKAALTSDELNEFKEYMRCVGAAGTVYDISSGSPVQVAFNLEIVRDPLLLKDTEAGRQTIFDAISVYLDSLDYGGEISTSGLIGAVLAVSGVKDIRYNHAIIDSTNIETVRIESTTGAFVLDMTNSIITMS